MSQKMFKISWRDSVGWPSLIHLTIDGKDTLCGGHGFYLEHREWIRVRKKNGGLSNYCRECFQQQKKSLPWHPSCI